jgi:uncharacterized protein YcnI
VRAPGKRSAFVGLLSIGILALGVAQASAHVTVSGTDDVRGGGDAIINFRAPNESATGASTIELQVQIPTNTPLASVLVQPVYGWTAAVTSIKLSTPIKTDDGDITNAVSEIVWKADSVADGIKPNQFQQFTIIVGQLPDTASLTFPAIQTYSDNTVVKWVQVEAPGSTADLDHPAPVLTLAAASGDSSGTAASGTGASSGTAASGTGASVAGAPIAVTVTGKASSHSVTIAIIIAAIGVLLGATGLAVGLSARAKTRGNSQTEPR